MNKYQRVLNQITKDTLKKEPFISLTELDGRGKVFRNARIYHKRGAKSVKCTEFENLLEMKKFHKNFDYIETI